MPLPGTPNPEVLKVLGRIHADSKKAHPLYPEMERRARAWLKNSFPGAKLFENRVQSLAILLTGVLDDRTLSVEQSEPSKLRPPTPTGAT